MMEVTIFNLLHFMCRDFMRKLKILKLKENKFEWSISWMVTKVEEVIAKSNKL